MTSISASAGGVVEARATTRTGPFADRDLILTNLWIAIVAFGLAACMAMMQALSRASLEVPYRSPRMYYMSVTAHGILMALVFTTFFIMALGDAVVDTEIGELPSRTLAKVSYAVAIVGTVMTLFMVFTFRASVLYTFYPPMQAQPAVLYRANPPRRRELGVVCEHRHGVAARAAGKPRSTREPRDARHGRDGNVVAHGHGRCGIRDALPAHPLVARPRAAHRPTAGPDTLLVLRASPRLFLGAASVHDLVHGVAARSRREALFRAPWAG